jgi:hypothetical protein
VAEAAHSSIPRGAAVDPAYAEITVGTDEEQELRLRLLHLDATSLQRLGSLAAPDHLPYLRHTAISPLGAVSEPRQRRRGRSSSRGPTVDDDACFRCTAGVCRMDDPGEARVFRLAELEQAKAWAGGA